MSSRVLKWLKARALVVRMHIERLGAWKSLHLIEKRPRLANATIVAIVVVRNERFRLEYFLSYHRRLGVEHFVIIDNESTDGTLEFLQGVQDVTCYLATGSYKKAHFGVNWVNFLASYLLHNRWVIVLDADELFVYPRMDELPLGVFCARLETIGCHAFNCVMVDLYGRGKVADTFLEDGGDPLEVLTHFDKAGYERRYVSEYDFVRITGGPRRRLFFQDAESAPTLNKTPLVKWRRHYLLIHSCHVLWPFRLNGEGELKAAGLSGALLHLKLAHDLISKTLEERARKQRAAEDHAYRRLDTIAVFEKNISSAYDGWRCLQKHGLLSEGRGGIWP
jgi:Glycosyl transferase family 2